MQHAVFFRSLFQQRGQMPFGATPTELLHTDTHREVFIHLSAALLLSGCVHTLSAAFIV